MRRLLVGLLLCTSLATGQTLWPDAEHAVTEVKEGAGQALTGKAAVQLKLRVWDDDFGGHFYADQGEREVVLVFDDQNSPIKGLKEILGGARVGAVRRCWMTMRALEGTPHDTTYYQKPLALEVEVLRVFPLEPTDWVSVREGSGERKTHLWDKIEIHYTLWLDGFQGQKRLHSKNVTFVLAPNMAPLAWQQGLQFMRLGEVRQLRIPYYLGQGCPYWDTLETPEPLYFEIELVEFKD